MTEARVRGAQGQLAQDAALGVHDGERCVVADRAEIAEVVGDALQLRHQGAQVNRARRRLDAERGLGGTREGERVGDGRVAGGAPRELRAALKRRAGHQSLDALVDIAEALLEPHDRLAICGEAEMAGLDDPGMHRTDRNLVQVLAFDGEEEKRRGPRRRFGVRPEWLHHVPGAEIEPRPQVPEPVRLESIEIADRTLEPDRRRMMRADRGKALVVALVADDAALARLLVEQRHVHGALLCPKAHQRPAAGSEIARNAAPGGVIHDHAWPRRVRRDLAQVRDRVD